MAILLCIAALYAVFFVDFRVHPIEDAAMLMRYAKHFADGYGVVWNIDGPPVDGATDFLFMLAVGFLVKIGLSLESATRSLVFVSHVATFGVVYLSLRRLYDTPQLFAFCSSIFLLAGPGFVYVANYFGTTVFSFAACVSWWAALDIILHGEDRKKAFRFSAAALVTGLIRPEGVFLTILMLLVVVFINGWRKSKTTIQTFASVFLVIGGAYFLWRWHYFGYPLPNPFYKKGGGTLHWDSLIISYVNTFFLTLWFLPAFLTGILFQKTRKKAIAYFFLCLGFASLFVLLSNEMNVLGRFQYVTLPLAAMSCWPLTEGLRDFFRSDKLDKAGLRLFSSTLVVSLFLVAGLLQFKIYNVRFYPEGKYNVAIMLSGYKNKGLRLATTEAGLLPLYSEWEAMDAWGLNDPWIAHHGGITEEYLAAFDPHIIMFHAYFSPLAETDRKGDWYDMVMVLKKYAEKNGYILAAAYGETPYQTEYYYVRADFPESAEIVERIRETDYPNLITGSKQINFAVDAGSQ